MSRAAVLLFSMLLAIPLLETSGSSLRDSDESEGSDGVLASEEVQTDGERRPNVTLAGPDIPQEIQKRMGDYEEEVTHTVGYNTHLDPHYYQRRDMGKYYDCALQGPWKPIHGHPAHREVHAHGAADGSGSHPQRPVQHHPHPSPNKQNSNGYGNYLEEWDQQLKNVLHGQHPPSGGSGYRKLPPGRGAGGGGRGIYQGGGVIHHHRPSGGGQPTQQVVYQVNGHQGAPLHHVHMHKHVPSLFGDDEWHHWFYSEEQGPYEHEGDESSQDHEDLASFHNSEEHVGDGGYPQGDGQEVPQESAEVEEGGYDGPYRGQHSGEQGDYPEEGEQGEDQSASYEDGNGSKEQSTNISGESAEGQSSEDKLPCEEEEEEEMPEETSNEGNAPAEEDLSYLEIMYPPPLPLPAQGITAPGVEEPQQQQSHSEGTEYAHHGHLQAPVQQIYDTSGYNSSPPKCPYAGHDHAVNPNYVHGVADYQSLPQEMLPPKQELRDTRGTMPILLPIQQYEVHEIYEDGGKEGGTVLRQPQAQQTSNYQGDVTQEFVFGQRIPTKQTVLKVYGKPVPSGPGTSIVHNSLGEEASYPEEQKVGSAVLRPPPLVLRDSFPKINGMKVLLDARRKRRPPLWAGGPSVRHPVKMPLLLRPRRIPQRPTARMTVTLP